MREIVDRLMDNKRAPHHKDMVFEGLEESDVIPLNEFLIHHGAETIWEETLEEALETELVGAQKEEYKVGDIIMPKSLYSHSSRKRVDPHKIMLIQSKKEENGIIRYRGFLLSSKVENSNKYGKYPNNIYIEDYATILYKGPRQHKEAFIRVDDIVEFTNKDLSTSGVWKGSVSYSFFRFVNNCYNNYKRGISNLNRRWTSNKDTKELA